MDWNVNTVDVYPEYESNSDVVYNVHWRVTKVDEEYSATTYGTQILSTSDIGDFVPFDELTSEVVKGWVLNAMGEEEVTSLEAGLDAQIESKKNPTSITKTLES
jgi:hypothetical protein